MPRLLLTADWHLHRSSARNREIEGKLRTQVLPLVAAGDWLAVLGDLTDGGQEEEYGEARRLLGPLRGRLLLCPGNHDQGLWGLLIQDGARRRWQRLVKEWHVPRRQQIGQRLVECFDSVRYSPLPFDLARGRLGVTERKRLARLIDDAGRADLRPTALWHHWPYCDDQTLLLEDRQAVLKLVEGRCDIACGHIHEADRREVAGSVALSVIDFRQAGVPARFDGGG